MVLWNERNPNDKHGSRGPTVDPGRAESLWHSINPQEFYALLLDVEERALKDAKALVTDMKWRTVQDLHSLARGTDSLMVHEYAKRLEAELRAEEAEFVQASN